MKTTENKKHIVVIGGGFAGLNFVKRLFRSRHFNITVVDKNNYNYFTPLLYQVATSFLEPSSISYPFRKLFRKEHIVFRMAELLEVDTAAHKLRLSDGGELVYDILVFAAGSKTNFFGNDAIRRHSFSLKGIDDAIYMRNELLKTLEKASLEEDPEERKKLLTVVIAGGGPTGVEVAGMLAESKAFLGNDYPSLKRAMGNIHVIDGSPYLLAPMSDKTHAAAYKALKKLGVQVKLNTQVKDFKNDQVLLSDGSVIEAKTLIWAAGVTANTFRGIDPASIGRGNRMITDSINKVQGYADIYAIGDISIQFTDKLYPNGHPQLAQPAIQQGKTLAKNLVRMEEGKAPVPFKYFDRGDMAIIGRQFAVADLFKHKVHLGGLLGLLSWLFIHVLSLVNYNNKIKTLYNWAVAYATKDQALRMIFRPGNRETVS
ncbi:NAD(P)/FAD-dependent oxidoreductase [Chitinophaga sp. GCM10012297]|uniref:NADH:ubiquinone reductase (non-electrogenic) n=1 Tax=Chitinophaga chungangae TaxID=2821488 RepID=A0ABS3YA11_9BACT|nr:NAD(P)/FAD-dependent oxidoreductase [Chitinophaga chungangae]MBO9151330.1 NAD(P)/FAD-dependent oxidoreductase [Chitinophaga chungangae]